MKGSNQYVYEKSTSKLIMGMFALGSLIAMSGCNSSLINSQPMQVVNNKPIASKTENASPLKTDKDYVAADDSAATADGISQVVSANNQFAIELYQQINKQPKQLDKIKMSFSHPIACLLQWQCSISQQKGKRSNKFKRPFIIRH